MIVRRRISLPGGLAPRTLLLGVAAALAIVTGWMWFRDSGFVAINQVDVVGASGQQGATIRTAIRNAAEDMTTLHVREDALRKALAPYPIVKDVRVQADFPHRLKVTVVEHEPVAVIVSGTREVTVAADGTLLRDTRAAASLPELPLRRSPSGTRVEGRAARDLVALLAAAPPALREQVGRVFLGPRGLTARLKAGSALYFGDGERLKAKWAAATAVLADASSKGATSLDLRVPERPAAGGLEQIATQDPAGT
ncbi:MAG TPA: FtsQ-type POTRA domain-containing protein [Solirubrobacteraceae bacterium]